MGFQWKNQWRQSLCSLHSRLGALLKVFSWINWFCLAGMMNDFAKVPKSLYSTGANNLNYHQNLQVQGFCVYSIFFYYSFWIVVRQSSLCLFIRSNSMVNLSNSSIGWSNVDCLFQNFAIPWHGSISTVFRRDPCDWICTCYSFNRSNNKFCYASTTFLNISTLL